MCWRTRKGDAWGLLERNKIFKSEFFTCHRILRAFMVSTVANMAQ